MKNKNPELKLHLIQHILNEEFEYIQINYVNRKLYIQGKEVNNDVEFWALVNQQEKL